MTDMTERQISQHLEIKASAGDSDGMFSEFMSAFEEFKRTNDGRLTQLEKRGTTDALTEEKLGRLNQALDGAKAAMERLSLEKARPALEAGRPDLGDEYKDAFSAYVKRGEEKALSIGSNPDGGYLVPADTESEITRRLTAVSPIRAIASVRNVSSTVYKKPVTLTGPAVGWVAETASRPQTNSQTIDLIDFPTAELYAMPAATSAFLDDAAVDVGQWIADEVNAAFAEQETAAFVSGNGTNKPKGFPTETMVAESAWAWDKLGYIATGVSGAWPAGDASDVLIDLVYALKAGYRQNASWVMNRKTQAAVTIEGVVSWREATASALAAAGLSVRDGADGLELVRPGAVATTIAADDLAKEDGPLTTRRRPDPSEEVARLALGFVDRERDYLAGTVTAMRPEGAAVTAENSALVLDAASARAAAEQLLLAASARRDTLEFALPPSAAGLEVGDVVALEGAGEGPFEIAEIRDGLTRKVSARAVPPVLRAAVLSDPPARAAVGPAPAAVPELLAAHLPPDPTSPGQSRLLLAAYASPWPGQVAIQLSATGARLARLARPAAMGELVTPLTAGPLHLRDRRSVEISLVGGHLSPVDFEVALAGGNRIAVETDAGEWEVLGFAGAELIAPGRYRLTNLLRGLGGSDVSMGPAAAGNRLVVLDGSVAVLPVEPDWLGGELALRAFAGRHDATGTAFATTLGLGPVLPLPPVHLRAVRGAGGDVALGWVRRSRADAGAWAAMEVPLEHLPEAYRVTILDGATPVRSLDVGAPAALYTAAMQTADFGAPPAAFDFTVAQLSPVFGAGHAAAGSFHA